MGGTHVGKKIEKKLKINQKLKNGIMEGGGEFFINILNEIRYKLELDSLLYAFYYDDHGGF